MIRKNKILITLSVLIAIFVSFIEPVNAEKYTGYRISPEEPIGNLAWRKQDANGLVQNRVAHFMRRSSDGEFVYCIQPMADIDNNYIYTIARSDFDVVTNLTLEQIERVTLLSYYGYQYGSHTDPKWYAITQILIWRTVEPYGNFYFTDGKGGSILYDLYVDEMAELESLVQNHYKKPKFNNTDIVIPLGQTISVNDENNVLHNFKVNSQNNVNASVSGNTLNITATGIGNANITLSKEDTKYQTPPLIYFNDHSQDVFRVGAYDPFYYNINLKVIGGRVEMVKKDKDTMEIIPSGQATLKNATYGVYKASTNELITTITTNENSYAISDYLPELGDFYLQEITPSLGYTLDTQKYYFSVTEDNLLAHVDVYEKVIERNFEITKVYATDKTMIMTPEIGVQFGIYDNNNNLVSIETTDLEGKIYFTVPFGSYTLKQLTVENGVEKIRDYHFTVREQGATINKVFSNAEISSRIKVVKADQDNKRIPISGIRFKIKDLNTNEYVCQKVYYPNEETYCEYQTNDEGVLITPYPLNRGSYQLEEIDQVIIGFLWNSTPLKFTIDNDSDIEYTDEFDKVIEIHFKNQEVLGKVEIHKVGEKLVFKDNTYTYEEIPLPNVVFGVYDENKNLVGTIKTDESGYGKLENLKLQKYTLKEISSSLNNVLDETEYEFELVYEDQYTPVITKTFTLKNYLPKGTLEFSKIDLSTSEPLPNTLIEIYNAETEELVFSGYTNDKGMVIIDDLPANTKFYILEKETSDPSYILNEEKMYFEILENGEVIKATMENEKKKGTLEFTKVDFSTSEALPNTLIEIYNAEIEELVFSGYTDEKGMIVIELNYGKYYILEKETSDPKYMLNTEKMYFEILENGEVIKATMTNEAVVQVPDTALNDYRLIEIISLCLITLGIGFIIYDRKNKRK